MALPTEKERIKAQLMHRCAQSDLFLFGEGLKGSEIHFAVARIKRAKRETAHYALKYFPHEQVMVVWNLALRRKYGGTEELHLERFWKDIHPTRYTAEAFYPTFRGKDKLSYYEKVLILGEEFFDSFFSNPEYWMAFNREDDNCPNLRGEEPFPDDRTRKEYSVKQKQRLASFRESVLKAYNYQCAVCRCKVPELLQAAHLHQYTVAETDLIADIPEHGICLCANHHLMYDKYLIDIDVKKGTATVLDSAVKDMAWYEEFENHQFKLVERKQGE